MLIHRELHALREALREARSAGQKIAFVPTMGALHAGHLRLAERAAREAELIVFSIYVNPMQFAAGEDLNRYPRDLHADRKKLEAAQVDHLFYPSNKLIYPQGAECHTRVSVPELSEILCGASRPGHFDGVATIVCKLLNIVNPDYAIFGEKDYQQLLIIRRLAEDLNFDCVILGEATAREANGLAMSSRNAYLNKAQRRAASVLYAELHATAEALAMQAPSKPVAETFAALKHRAYQSLEDNGLNVEYYELRDAQTLREIERNCREARLLAAASLEGVRLIDNLAITLPAGNRASK